MSLENEHGSSVIEASEATQSQRKPKISYTIDLLLSLSALDTCKGLPSDFDRSVLSEFEDASLGTQDQTRSHGILLFQGFRRNDYSSSPPTHGETGKISRGVHGRWDNHSPGWSDKDSGSQSDLDSDSGRRIHGNQSWRPRHDSEHDGILGRGSFPRPSGYAAPKVKTDEHYQLSKSSEPYHPPRPFKAVSHSRTSTNDAFNDETFGSSECTSEDRAEEERKRRASFELMRKEHQKVLQEKKKSDAGKHQSDCFDDLSLEAREKGLLETSCELDPEIPSVPNNDSRKSSFLSQSSKSRPLVPPGFRSTVLEKSSTKPVISSTDKENPKPEIKEIHLPVKGKIPPSGTLHELNTTEKLPEDTIGLGLKLGEATMNSLSGSGVSNEKLGMGDLHTYRTSGIPEVYETVGGGEVFELGANQVKGNKIVSNSGQGSSTSILEKLFGETPTKVGGSSGYIQQQESKPDDSINHTYAQTSKFAQRFSKDEKRPMNDLSSGRPNDLLSLVVGSQKTGSPVSDITSTEHIQPEQPYNGLELTNILASTLPPDTKHLYNNYRQEALPPVAAVLTCEDLEQTILLEHIGKSSVSQTPVPEWSISDQENVNAKEVDNQATHHLLSLLQKGTTIENTKPDVEEHSASKIVGVTVPTDANVEDTHKSGQSLTLETLFGSAFMKELQSSEAPVSVQRGSARTDMVDHLGLTPTLMQDDASFSASDGTESNHMIYDNDLFSGIHKQPPKSKQVQSWLPFDGLQTDVDNKFSNFPKEEVDGAEILLPEEESLIAVGDPSNCHIAGGVATKQESMPSDATFNIAKKLAALSSGFSMAAQGSPRVIHSPYDLLGPERQFSNLPVQDSCPPQMHAAQMNRNQMTMFPPLDPHVNSQMRFTQYDSPYHQSLPNMVLPFHQPDLRMRWKNVPPNHQMLPQMPMPGNFPPQLLHDFSRPLPLPPHRAINLMPDTEAVHGFPFGHGQPNIGGLRMPSPGGGNVHPEAFERMMEMGDEVEMGSRSRYR